MRPCRTTVLTYMPKRGRQQLKLPTQFTVDLPNHLLSGQIDRHSIFIGVQSKLLNKGRPCLCFRSLPQD